MWQLGLSIGLCISFTPKRPSVAEIPLQDILSVAYASTVVLLLGNFIRIGLPQVTILVYRLSHCIQWDLLMSRHELRFFEFIIFLALSNLTQGKTEAKYIIFSPFQSHRSEV